MNHIEKMHSKQIDLKCSLCDKTFTRSRCLKDHVQNSHILPSNLNECNICQKTFSVKRTLLNHQKSVHTTFGNYFCELCGTFFKRIQTIRKHIKKFHETSQKLE